MNRIQERKTAIPEMDRRFDGLDAESFTKAQSRFIPFDLDRLWLRNEIFLLLSPQFEPLKLQFVLVLGFVLSISALCEMARCVVEQIQSCS
jgi:hypothetical protein